MGGSTEHAKHCFAELVSLAKGPCSLTAFDTEAHVLGSDFRSPAELRAARLPKRGRTNITAGMEGALGLIERCELEEEAGTSGARQHTHHILILLSDGAHNQGARPQEQLPKTGRALRDAHPSLRLSVVVVGVTASSDTAMGMLMKTCLETVPLPSLAPIYFASSPAAMTEVLSRMREGLASLTGAVSTVSSAPGGGHAFLRAVGEDAAPSVDLLVEPREQAVLCFGTRPPAALLVAKSPMRELPR